MRGIKRLSYAQLAQLVGHREGVSVEAIHAALKDSERGQVLFPEALVQVGAASEWELMRLVAVEFGLPVIPAGQHDLDRELVRSFPVDLISSSLVVPLDRFQRVLTVVMPILAPHEVLEAFGVRSGCEVFAAVGSVQDNRRVLEPILRASRRGEENTWERLFDEANAQVMRETRPQK